MQRITSRLMSHTTIKATALKENKNGKINCYKQAIQETRKRLSLRRNQKHRKDQGEKDF